MALKQCIILFIWLHSSLAKQEFKVSSMKGNCPKNFTHVSNVNVTRLQGAYYIQLRSNDTGCSGCDDGCYSSFGSRINDHQIYWATCAQRKGVPICGEDIGSVTETIDSSGKATDQGIFGTIDGYYLEIKYGKHFIFFSCEPTKKGPPIVNVYAITHGTPVAPKGFANRVRKILKKNNVVDHVLYKVTQNCKCNYPFACDKFYE